MESFDDDDDERYLCMEDPSNFIQDQIVYILINTCYGGFGISAEGLKLYNEKLLKLNPTAEPKKYDLYIKRDDPILHEVYRELGSKINKRNSKIRLEVDRKSTRLNSSH